MKCTFCGKAKLGTRDQWWHFNNYKGSVTGTACGKCAGKIYDKHA